MKKLMERVNRRDGFTLAELLIVVAIIGVLVAISIPVFNGQLEKAREATDEANIRAAYAEATAAALTETDTGNATYSDGCATVVLNKIVQKDNTWKSGAPTIGGVTVPNCKTGQTVTIKVYTNGTTPTSITVSGS